MDGLTKSLFISEVPASKFKNDPNSVLAVHEEGKMGLIRIKPDYHASEDYKQVAKSVVTNIGNYRKDDLTVLRTHYNSVDMCMAVYEAIVNTGGKVYIIPGYMEKMLDFLLRGMTDEEKAKKFFEIYGKAVQAAGHWTMTYARIPHTLSEEAKANKETYFNAHYRVFSKLFDEKMEKGQLASFDMIHCPQPREAENIGMDFETYQDIIFKAMKIDDTELLKKERAFALERFGYELRSDVIMGKSGRFRVSLGKTEIEFSIEGRQLIVEGPPGTNYFVKKKTPEVITNHPHGEVFVSPIENSVNGRVETNIPKSTQAGLIKSLSTRIQNGMILDYDTPDVKVFRSTFPTFAERTVAEVGFGGFNKELIPIRETGKPTGVLIVDEKVYPVHIAFGDNIVWGGENRAIVHEDFSIPEEIYGKRKRLTIEHIL